MNAIEQGRARYERNKAARERVAAKKALEAHQPIVDLIEIPAERPLADAVIDVTVRLPDGEHRFTFTRKDVLQNVPKHRLTSKEFRRCFVDGLKPLLGDVL